MHIVEIRRNGADLGSVMAQMRTWADHYRVETTAFEVAFIAGGEVRFRLSFGALTDASAFARAFDGDLAAPADKIAAA
jgi:hypothetical protein